MVVGIRVIGKKLKSRVAIDALGTRTCHCVIERVGSYRACRASPDYRSIAVGTGNDNRVRHGRSLRLQAVARLSQMHGVRAHIAHLQHPLFAQRALHRQVPLLRAGYNEVPRHGKSEDIGGEKRPGASASGSWSVTCRLIRVAAWKTLKDG